MEWIEEQISKVEREVYKGKMPTRNKLAMKRTLLKESIRDGERSLADYVYGYDDGEVLVASE